MYHPKTLAIVDSRKNLMYDVVHIIKRLKKVVRRETESPRKLIASREREENFRKPMHSALKCTQEVWAFDPLRLKQKHNANRRTLLPASRYEEFKRREGKISCVFQNLRIHLRTI